MRRYLENRERERMEIQKILDFRSNRRIKYIALGIIGIGIILQIISIIFIDSLPIRTLLFMRGCTGICAILFFVLAGIYIYRGYSKYWQDRNSSHHNSGFK